MKSVNHDKGHNIIKGIERVPDFQLCQKTMQFCQNNFDIFMAYFVECFTSNQKHSEENKDYQAASIYYGLAKGYQAAAQKFTGMCIYYNEPISQRSLAGDCIIIPEYNLLFLQIPKNASTTIENALNNSKIKFYTSNLHTEPNLQKYTKIAILRDPISRFISGYLEALKRAEVDNIPNIWSSWLQPFTQGNNLIGSLNLFLDDLNNLGVDNDDVVDQHVRSQKYYLFNKNKLWDIKYKILLNKNLQKNIIQIFREHGYTGVFSITKDNEAVFQDRKQFLINFFNNPKSDCQSEILKISQLYSWDIKNIYKLITHK